MKKIISYLVLGAFLFSFNSIAYLTPVGGGGGGGGAVDSVNGQTGVVSLDSDDIAEGATNLWFTDGRSQSACWNGFSADRILITNSSGTQSTSNVMGLSQEGGLSSYLNYTVQADGPSDINPGFGRFETEVDPDGNDTVKTHVSGFSTDIHYDRTGSGGDFEGGISGVSLNFSHEGEGYVSNIWGRNDYMVLGTDSVQGTAGSVFAYNSNLNFKSGFSVSDVYLLNYGIEGTGATIGNFSIMNVGGSFNLTGDYRGDSHDFGGSVGGNYSGHRRSINANVTGDVTMGQYQMTGNANSFSGLSISANGAFTTNAQALNIDMSNAVVNGGNDIPTGLNINGGSIGANVTWTIPGAASFLQAHYVGGALTIASGDPVSAYGFGINLAQSLILHDDWTVDGAGLGFNAVGFVGSIAIDSGKTLHSWTGALAGAGNPSGAGTVTNAYMFRAAGFLGQGGSLTSNNMYAYYAMPTLCSTVVGSCYGMYIDDANAKSILKGELEVDKGVEISTTTTKPTCDSSKRGLIWNEIGGAGVADVAYICQKNAADAYVWNSI